MDILAIIGLGALLRLLARARTRQRQSAAAPPPDIAVSPIPSSRRPLAPPWCLLLHAGRGLLLAGLLLVAALLPWPTAWALSAALLPSVQDGQHWTLHNIDLITVGAVAFALIEPVLALGLQRLRRLLRGLWQLPHLIVLLVHLAWVNACADYWRYRNWRLRSIDA